MTPSYGQIGIASAIILFCARMVVTALVSSGTDGIRIYIYEQIGVKRQCLGNGLISTAAQIGSFSASMSGLLLTLDFLPDYAWRFAFLFGSVLGICVAILRVKYPDSEEVISKNTPEYDIYKDVNTFTIVFRNFKMFLKCSILAGCIGSTYQFIIIFFGTYNFEILKFISASKMQFYTSVGVILYMTFAIIGGLCADVFGRRIVAIVASYVVVLLSVIMSYTIAHNVIPISVYFLINIALPFLTMPALAFLKQSIPTVIRYRIFSLAHAFGSLIISAPTAFISTYIFHKTSINWLPMVYFIVANIAIIVVILSINQPKDESSLRAKYSNPVTIFRNTHYDR
jgi:MFS family permease